MADDRKGMKLSRRSFLKGIGGGAIGGAALSTGLIQVRTGAGVFARDKRGGARQNGAQSQGQR